MLARHFNRQDPDANSFTWTSRRFVNRLSDVHCLYDDQPADANAAGPDGAAAPGDDSAAAAAADADDDDEVFLGPVDQQ